MPMIPESFLGYDGLKDRQFVLLMILTVAGLMIAAVSGLGHRFQWFASLCAGFTGGCRETANFSLLTIPVWIWGVGFYLALTVALLYFRKLLLWLVPFAFGVELSLMWVMFSLRTVCIFCMANFLIIALLTLLVFQSRRFWQMLAVSLLASVLCTLVITDDRPLKAEALAKKSEHIAAVIDGHTITREELERPIASRIYKLQLEMYQLKKARLDQMIADIVLRKEAARKDLTVQQLLSDPALTQGISVSDAEVEQYYAENRARLANWKGSEQQLKTQIKASLQQEKTYQKVMDYVKALSAGVENKVYLEEPQLPLANIAAGHSPVLGPAEAPITIVEFSDYRCPSCRNYHQASKPIKERYRDKIRWIFKDFPLSGNEISRTAAEAAHCAGDQHRFWEYQDLLFSSKNELDTAQLQALAGQLNLDREEFDACLASGKYRAEVENDLQEARKIGVDRTPTLIINGRMVPGGLSAEQLEEMINAELKKNHAAS